MVARLEEILEQKYKSIEQIREEYPNVVQIFKNSMFPGEIINWLSACLDDLGERPIIVRSSSLLEDRFGTAHDLALALEARAYAREWSAERNARRLAGFYEAVLAQHAARSEAGEPETA